MSSFAIYEAVAKSRQGGGYWMRGVFCLLQIIGLLEGSFKDRDDVELFFTVLRFAKSLIAHHTQRSSYFPTIKRQFCGVILCLSYLYLVLGKSLASCAPIVFFTGSYTYTVDYFIIDVSTRTPKFL